MNSLRLLVVLLVITGARALNAFGHYVPKTTDGEVEVAKIYVTLSGDEAAVTGEIIKGLWIDEDDVICFDVDAMDSSYSARTRLIQSPNKKRAIILSLSDPAEYEQLSLGDVLSCSSK